ncbi:hypothetical protein K0M31_014040 [Melipona bicolor]|uniref:Uncharacterized protein n=1 Tax=Melipona bicolor TaxID=60889 RepID=A0AA40G808_9HYME|nr:hypothetical protein K0M31_014040 [Melipona bicolor]
MRRKQKKKKKKKKKKKLVVLCANEPAKPRNPPENGEENTDLPLIYGYPPRVFTVLNVVNVSTISNGVPSVYARARPPRGQTCLVRVVPRVLRKFERKFTR